MTLYAFERSDGETIERWFPMGTCPKEIICEDGIIATRIYGFNVEPSPLAKKERRTKDNIKAGNKGKAEWKQRNPKFGYLPH